MNWLRELARRLRMLMHRRQFDADLEEEMQSAFGIAPTAAS